MALLGNYNVLSKCPGRYLAGNATCDRSDNNKSGSARNIWYGRQVSLGGIAYFNGKPVGYAGGYAWLIPQTSGGLAMHNGFDGFGDITYVNLAGGLNAVAPLTGSGDITSASGQLIVSAIAAITASGSFTGNINAILDASAALAGSGDISASLVALGNAVAAIIASGTIAGTFLAPGTMSADITSQSALSPDSLAAAVWNSVASAFNIAGTMGNKLNSAASAGDPWSTDFPGSYTGTEAGAILAQIQTLVDELHQIQGLSLGNPMTVTPTSRDVGTITMAISGDGTTSSTVTRET